MRGLRCMFLLCFKKVAEQRAVVHHRLPQIFGAGPALCVLLRDLARGAVVHDHIRVIDRDVCHPLLEVAHRAHGKRRWASLFDSALELAENGFAISPRLNAQIAANATSLARDAAAAGYFLEPDGNAKAAGTLLENPAYAETLKRLRREAPYLAWADIVFASALTGQRVERILREALRVAEERYRRVPTGEIGTR